MLFNSCQFIFLFLPIALIGYFVLGKSGNKFGNIGSGDMAGAGVAGVLRDEQLAVCVAAAGVDCIQLPHRLLADLGTRARRPAIHGPDDWRRGTIFWCSALQICRLPAANLNAIFRLPSRSTSCFRSGFHSTLHPDRSWLMPTGGKVAHYALPHYALFVTVFSASDRGAHLHHKDMIPQFGARSGSGPMRI